MTFEEVPTKIRVLSIDGGGIKGVGPAHILARLDEKLTERGTSVSDSFQLFAGTSTGCIIAAGLAADGQAKQRLRAIDIENLYRHRGKEMFAKKWPGLVPWPIFRAKYKAAAKGAVLQSILGDLTLGEIERDFVGTFYNVGEGPGPIFPNGGKTYRKEKDNNYAGVPVWEAVNESSNAPYFFDPSSINARGHLMRGADGGVFANNPAMCAYIEAKKLWRGVTDILVASFGCGQSKLNYSNRERWGALQWALNSNGVPLLEAMFDGQSETVSYQMQRVLPTHRYFRFQFDLPDDGKVRMDDASETNINRIIECTDTYLSTSGNALLDKLIEQLLL